MRRLHACLSRACVRGSVASLCPLSCSSCAPRYTEVGFHGRDVDQIIRDLVDSAITQTKQKTLARKKAQVQVRARVRRRGRRPSNPCVCGQRVVEERLLDLLTGEDGAGLSRETFRTMLRAGQLDERHVDVDAPDAVRALVSPRLLLLPLLMLRLLLLRLLLVRAFPIACSRARCHSAD